MSSTDLDGSSISDEELRRRLTTEFKVNVGPVTPSTRRVLLKKLAKLEKGRNSSSPDVDTPPPSPSPSPPPSPSTLTRRVVLPRIFTSDASPKQPITRPPIRRTMDTRSRKSTSLQTYSDSESDVDEERNVKLTKMLLSHRPGLYRPAPPTKKASGVKAFFSNLLLKLVPEALTKISFSTTFIYVLLSLIATAFFVYILSTYMWPISIACVAITITSAIYVYYRRTKRAASEEQCLVFELVDKSLELLQSPDEPRSMPVLHIRLEDTCSVGARSSSKGRHHHHSGNENCRTAEEEKTLLEKNSFLFALFNQYVPHNRIPLESLSKYVRRLQKYEILATIEFSFLKTPSINVQQQQQQQTNRRTTSGDRSPITTTTNGPNGIISSTSASVGKRQYAIPSQSACSMRQAYRRENLPKNTNQRYVPFDYNRVVLRGGENQRKGTGTQASSDYINASHVDSLLKPNAYIVAQGPNEVTVGDFWRMLWQQNVHVVVMLTKVYEFIRVMCTQYWPSALHKPELYDEGTFEVTLVDEDRLADYVVRTMKVRNLREFPKTREEEEKEKEEKEANQASTSKTTSSSAAKHSEKSSPKYRTIYQLHFLSWNVNSCPYSDSILKFRRRVQIYEKQCQAEAAAATTAASTSSSSGTSGPGPLVVHCSTGCGRSGTYVCLDANLALAEEEGVLDIFNYARALRRARVSMIEQLEQYRFIYETIEESVVCGKTWFHVSEISAQMKAKSAKRVAGGTGNGNGKRGGRRRGNNSNNSNVGKNEYQVEFEKLLRMTSSFSIGDCAGGHRLENRYKNRDVSIVPPDNFRPYLTSYQSKDNTDYINAVFVDGYSRPREYIVTEWPLRSTIADIWSLIYDHDCNTVVVLGGVPPNASKSAFPPFWPKDQLSSPSKSSSSSSIPPTKYGPIWTVETISTNHPPNISSWVLRVHKKVMSLTELMAGIKAEPKITQVFEFGAWPADYKVPTSTNALVELIHMVERWRQRTSYGPVLVVSANGKSRVGVYCAANFAIEQVVAHEEIDIFNAVKTVRRHRSALIETIMEYKYCYDLCLHYYSHYMSKGNYNQIFRKNL